MNKNQMKRSETAKMLQSWTMQLAHYLADEENLPWSDALKLAHLNCSLLFNLGRGRVTFAYKKGDGVLRGASGTLCRKASWSYDDYLKEKENSGILENEETNKKHTSDNIGTFRYWDINKRAFRSFKAKNLIRISEVTIPLNKKIRNLREK